MLQIPDHNFYDHNCLIYSKPRLFTWFIKGNKILFSSDGKVNQLQALTGTGRLYPPRNIPVTHFCYRLSQLQGHSAAGRIMLMKNSNNTKGNRTATFRLVLQCLNLLHYPMPLIYCQYQLIKGARGSVVVKPLRYKPAGRVFDSRWCHGNFSVT